MDENENREKEFQASLAKAKEIGNNANKKLKDQERLLRLAHAGLQSMPLERDFYDRMCEAVEVRKRNLEEGNRPIELIENIKNEG